MRVSILKESGFCGGVIKALHTLDETIKKNKDKNIYLLGPIVHNDEVNKKYEELGVKIIDLNKLKKIDKDSSIIITSAHGISDCLKEKLKDFTHIDTSCPFVLKNESLIKNSDTKNIIFIGKKNHAETVALTEDNKNINVVETIDDLMKIKPSLDDGIVYNQTTINIDKLNEIYSKISDMLPNYKLVNTLCPTTIKNQSFIKNVDPKYNIVLIVGDKSSNNARSLVELSNYKRTYFISNINDLKNITFSTYDSVIIIGSASTPKTLLSKIKEYLEKMSFE